MMESIRELIDVLTRALDPNSHMYFERGEDFFGNDEIFIKNTDNGFRYVLGNMLDNAKNEVEKLMMRTR